MTNLELARRDGVNRDSRCRDCSSDLWDSGVWPAFQSGWGKAIMAGKDKGGRSSKTPAAKTAKEKRQAKKEKKAGKGSV